MTIQNGTHRGSPPNPIPAALDGLQTKLLEVISGFETRFEQIKRAGEKAFDAGGGQEIGEDTPQVSILPVPDQDNFDAGLPGVIIGKGEQEVLEALARAEEGTKQ